MAMEVFSIHPPPSHIYFIRFLSQATRPAPYIHTHTYPPRTVHSSTQYYQQTSISGGHKLCSSPRLFVYI